jgi:P-type Ca2+ transporter type 2C
LEPDFNRLVNIKTAKPKITFTAMINKAWHTKTVKECLDLLKTAPEGLPGPEVSIRQDKYGLNKIEEGGRKGPLSMLLSQFKDIMILILIGAAAISAVAGDLKDTIVILVIVFLNALVGFIQEYRAEKAMHALKKMSAARAKVLRDGRTHTINAEELVPGDIVMLEAGDIIPADLRLMEAHSLMTEEASLTGESFPVKKTTEPVPDEKIPLGDRLNIAFKSTLVTYGRGKGVVVGTGMNTEIGSIAGMLQGKDSLTPLQHRLKVFARKLSFVVIGICIVIFFLGLQRGEDPVSMLLTALSVAVAAIPEALPAVITIALSLGAKKLVKQNALIRKLPAVETLGAVTFICSDKTGTLTQNKMTVKEVRLPEEKILDETDNDSLLKISMLLNQDTRLENNRVIGDPTETALVEYALRSRDLTDKVKSLHRVAELPFDSDRKLMTTIHNWGSGFLVVTKGALEAVLSKCPAPGTDEILQEAAKLGEKGMRILGFAVKIINVLPEDLTHEEVEKELSFLGFCGMIDPPRIEAKQAVAECVRAGIIPVMITGDHPVTAKAIAKEIGILSAPEQQGLCQGLAGTKASDCNCITK